MCSACNDQTPYMRGYEPTPDCQSALEYRPRVIDHGLARTYMLEEVWRICKVSSDVNRFYPKTQLSWLARLDHSHCNSADPLTDGLEVCCVFYRPGVLCVSVRVLLAEPVFG